MLKSAWVTDPLTGEVLSRQELARKQAKRREKERAHQRLNKKKKPKKAAKRPALKDGPTSKRGVFGSAKIKKPKDKSRETSLGETSLPKWKPGTSLRKSDGYWNPYPRAVFASKYFTRLSVMGQKLLIDLFTQFNGFNNGKLCASLGYLQRERGWGKSPETLARAIQELLDARFIRRTRERTRHRSAWYEITFITEENGA